MTAVLEAPPEIDPADGPEHENGTRPDVWWYDEEIVRRALIGHWHLVHRKLSRAEMLTVLGVAIDAADEAVREGRATRRADCPNTMDALQRRFSLSGTQYRKMMNMARPFRARPVPGKSWQRISDGPAKHRRREPVKA